MQAWALPHYPRKLKMQLAALSAATSWI